MKEWMIAHAVREQMTSIPRPWTRAIHADDKVSGKSSIIQHSTISLTTDSSMDYEATTKSGEHAPLSNGARPRPLITVFDWFNTTNETVTCLYAMIGNN